MRREFQVIIEPYEVGTIKKQHLKQVLLQRLKESYEGKCTPYGYIKSVNKILSVSDGQVYDCDLSGRVVYDVTANIDNENYESGDIISVKIENRESNDSGAYVVLRDPFIFFILDNGEDIDFNEEVKVEVRGKRIIPEDNVIHLVTQIC